MAIIGTCSKCKGPVETPDDRYSTEALPAKCRHCGASQTNQYGPVIQTAHDAEVAIVNALLKFE